MLTDVACRNAQPKEKPFKIFDTNGLFLLINPSASKLWRMKYRFEGKERLLSFGCYPDIPLKEARRKRDEARETLAQGVDPSQTMKAAKRRTKMAPDNTFKTLAISWLEFWRVNKAKKTIQTAEAMLEHHIYPDLGHRVANELTVMDFVDVVRKAELLGLGDTTRRIWQRCNQIMRFGIVPGLVERNPLADMEPGDILRPYKPQNHKRIDAIELPQLLIDIEQYRGHIYTRLALKLMVLTFVRTSELIKAEWVQIEWENALWRIPEMAMKEVDQIKAPHLVPLSKQTLKLLSDLKTLTGHKKYLFPGEQGAETISNNTLIYALYRMGYHSRMTGHGFRGLASTILHELDWPHAHIEIQLAHQERDKVSAAYNYATYLKGRRTMMQAWADYIDGLLVK
jgi:integrase